MHNRPTWALGWTNLAENSILLNGLDSRSEHALRLAAALAPWEPGVQQQVIWLGLSLWDLLSPEVRDTVRDLVGRSVAIDNDIPAHGTPGPPIRLGVVPAADAGEIRSTARRSLS